MCFFFSIIGFYISTSKRANAYGVRRIPMRYGIQLLLHPLTNETDIFSSDGEKKTDSDRLEGETRLKDVKLISFNNYLCQAKARLNTIYTFNMYCILLENWTVYEILNISERLNSEYIKFSPSKFYCAVLLVIP